MVAADLPSTTLPLARIETALKLQCTGFMRLFTRYKAWLFSFSLVLFLFALSAWTDCKSESKIKDATTTLASTHASPPLSVEQLPADRFDEYQVSTVPPYPWQSIGTLAEGVRLSLQTAGESPFISNRITGKGLVLSDSSSTTGQHCGVTYSFAPPPQEQLYLGFDFALSGALAEGGGVDLTCELTDDSGKGFKVRLGEAGELQAGPIQGPLQRICSLLPDHWYHVAIQFPSQQEARLTVTNSHDKARLVQSGVIALGPPVLYRHLRFYSGGTPDRTGGWMLDNVLMAGKVDAPREAWLPFKQASTAELRASPRKAFAYYYEIYPSGYSDEDPGLIGYTRKLFNPSLTPADRLKAGTELLYRPLPRAPMATGLKKEEVMIRAMEEEVRLAIQMGLDGFLLDFFALPESYDRPAEIRGFNERSFALMEAAKRVDSNFKIIPAIYAGPKPPPNLPAGVDVETAWTDAYADSPIVKQALTHPQAYRLEDGRVLLSKWGTERYSAQWWQRVIDRLNTQKIPVTFLGQFNGCSVEKLNSYASLCYAMADWGPRSPIEYHWVPKVRPITSVVISPIALQDMRTRERCYWEAHNSETLRKTWMAAIEDQSDWIFITTWSDYTEQAQAPSTSIGFSAHDLNTYYLQWFKLGVQPPIVKDTLYYFYRRHHTDIDPGRGEKWRLIKEGGDKAVDTRNEIELLAFLKEPGELRIQIGNEIKSMPAGKGITSFKVPLPPGQAFVPIFSLWREGQSVISGRGRYAILDKVEYPNLMYHAGIVTSEPLGK